MGGVKTLIGTCYVLSLVVLLSGLITYNWPLVLSGAVTSILAGVAYQGEK